MLLGLGGVSFLGFWLLSCLTGGSVPGSLGSGAAAALSVVVAGTLSWRLDPFHSSAALLAAVAQIPVVALAGVPSPFFILWVLIVFQIIDRRSPVDGSGFRALLVTALSMWLGWQFCWLIAAVASVVFFSAVLMKRPGGKYCLYGILTTAGAVYFLVADPGVWGGFTNYPYKLAMALVISVAFMGAIFRIQKKCSPRVQEGEKPFCPGVLLAQILSLLLALLLPLWAGVNGFHASAIFWAVLGSVSLVNGGSWVREIFSG